MLKNTSADAPFTNINASLLRAHLDGIHPEFSREAVAVSPRSPGEHERAHVSEGTPDEKARCELWTGREEERHHRRIVFTRI